MNELIEQALVTNNLEDIPQNYNDVLKHLEKEDYLKAMELEIRDLKKNETWVLVKRPKNTPIIKGRWVLSKKLNLDNSIKKYKAR